MTRYTVVWGSEALNELAEIWMTAGDRVAVTKAVRSIDQQLADRPSSTGDDLHEGLRQLVEPPLRVLFEVQSADRVARVLTVKMIQAA